MTHSQIETRLEMRRGEHRDVCYRMKNARLTRRELQALAHEAVEIEGEIAQLERKRAEICEGVR